MSIEEDEHRALAALEPKFMTALKAIEDNRVDTAEDLLKAILIVEPRLPEPHMELARVYLAMERLEEAEEHARMAVEMLENTGPWLDGIEDEVVASLGHALLAEVLRRRLEEDDVIFGDPNEFRRLTRESQEHFATAARLDPSDETSSYYAFFMGTPEEMNLPGASPIDVDDSEAADDDEAP